MTKSLSTLFGFVVLAALCYGAYLTFSWLASSFADIDPSVGAAIIAGATAVISSAYIASYNARRAKERAAMEAHRERKTEVYNEFMDVLIKVIKNTKAGKEEDDMLPGNFEEFFYKFTSKVIVYGGPGVVKAFGAWKGADFQGKGAEMFLLMDTLLREMRTDLGESNTGIETLELLGLLIKGGKPQIEKDLKEE